MGYLNTRLPGARDDRGLSPDLWGKCPREDIKRDFFYGYWFETDWTEGDEAVASNWTLTQATSGSSATDVSETHGVISIDSGATTATQGPNIQLGSMACKPAAGVNIYFESYFELTGIANLNVEFFLGLAEIDTTIIASSAVSTANHVGFSSVTDDGIILANAEKAGTGATDSDIDLTVAASTWTKLGFIIEGLDRIRWFRNGEERTSLITPSITTAHIPIVDLYPSIVIQSGGTDQPVMQNDWVSVFVENRDDST